VPRLSPRFTKASKARNFLSGRRMRYTDAPAGSGGPIFGDDSLEDTMTGMRALFIVAVAGLALSVAANGQARPSDAQLVEALRGGGHVIVMRHGATFNDQADTDPLNPDNIAKQRQLNAKGEEAAKAFGQALKQMGVPVGKVITSYFNRAYQTAKLAGFD